MSASGQVALHGGKMYRKSYVVAMKETVKEEHHQDQLLHSCRRLELQETTVAGCLPLTVSSPKFCSENACRECYSFSHVPSASDRKVQQLSNSRTYHTWTIADFRMNFPREALSTFTFFLTFAFAMFVSTIRQRLSLAFIIFQMPMVLKKTVNQLAMIIVSLGTPIQLPEHSKQIKTKSTHWKGWHENASVKTRG